VREARDCWGSGPERPKRRGQSGSRRGPYDRGGRVCRRRKGPYFWCAVKEGRNVIDDESETSKIRELQIKLYAGEETTGYRSTCSTHRFIARTVCHAYEQARVKQGAPGVDDGPSSKSSRGGKEWLTGIRQELRNRSINHSRCAGVIPKPEAGSEPSETFYKDRVCKTQPRSCWSRLRADMEPSAYGYDRSEARRTLFGKCIS